MNNDSKAFKSGIWYTASNFLVRSIGFITTPIFTRILTKAEFGLYNNYTSWLAIITIFVTLNLESTLISARFDYEDDFDGYILSMLALSTVSTGIWFLVLNVFSQFFTAFLGMGSIYYNAMLLYLLFLPAVNLFQARERYYFEYKKTVATSLAISLGTALVSVLLVVTMEDRLLGRVVGSIIPTILFGIIFFLFFVKEGKRVRLSYWKYALPICLPFIPHLLSLNLLNTMDRIMITRWCSPEDNAMYSLAYSCGSIVTMLLVSLNSAYAPWLGEKLNKNEYSDVSHFSDTYIYVFFYMAVGIMAVAPEVLLILGGKSYSEARYVMTPIAMGCVCQFLYSMFVNVEQFKKKTVGMAIASMIAAFVNFVLNSIFIPRIGYLAAAYTTLAGYLCLLGMHMYLVYRLGYGMIYHYKTVYRVILAGLAVTVVMTLMYSHSVIRYGFVAVYAGFGLYLANKYKDIILSVLKKKSL